MLSAAGELKLQPVSRKSNLVQQQLYLILLNGSYEVMAWTANETFQNLESTIKLSPDDPAIRGIWRLPDINNSRTRVRAAVSQQTLNVLPVP